MSSSWPTARSWWRHTVRRPLTYGLGVAVLALGVAALTAVASIYRDLISRPLPFVASEKIVKVALPVRLSHSQATIPEEFAASPAFAAIGFDAQGEANVVVAGRPERMAAAVVDPGFFKVFNVRPITGRPFVDSDGQQETITVISEKLWVRLGRESLSEAAFLTVGGRPFRIVGVMPGEFSFPGDTQLWVLPSVAREIGGAFFLPEVIARLAPQIDSTAASEVLSSAAANSFGFSGRVSVEPLEVSVYGSAGILLPLLLTVVVVALIATCAAVCSLWLSVLFKQRTELEVRFALGASRMQLYRQLALQFFVPLLVADFAGVGLARAALHWWVPISKQSSDGASLWLLSGLIGFGILCFSGLGILIAARGLLAAVGMGLRVRFRSFRRFYTWLSVGQTMVAFGLVSIAVVFIDTVGTVLPVDVGLANADARSFRLNLPTLSYENSGSVHQFIRGIEREFQATPGVRNVGVVTALPGDREPVLVSRLVIERPKRTHDVNVAAKSLAASVGFFKSAGVRIIAGRSFSEDEMLGKASVAIVSQETVRRFGLTMEEAVGARIRHGEPRNHEVVTIVGVVADVLYSRENRPVIYEPLAQKRPLPRHIAVVFDAIGSVSLEQVMAIVERNDPNLPIFGFTRLEELSLITANERSIGWLLICLAATSILQCLFALYGISAQLIEQEMRNIAVAVVLGLTPIRAMTRVLFILVGPTLFGTALGVVITLLAVRTAQSLIPRLAGPAVASLATTGVVFLLISLAASVLPARRTTTVDLSRILSSE